MVDRGVAKVPLPICPEDPAFRAHPPHNSIESAGELNTMFCEVSFELRLFGICKPVDGDNDGILGVSQRLNFPVLAVPHVWAPITQNHSTIKQAGIFARRGFEGGRSAAQSKFA